MKSRPHIAAQLGLVEVVLAFVLVFVQSDINQRLVALEQLDRARQCHRNFPRQVPVHRPAGHEQPAAFLPRPDELMSNRILQSSQAGDTFRP